MTDDLPDAPDGWRAMRTDDGRPRFDSEDRTLAVVCTKVSTLNGEVYNCRLFESDAAYQFGEAVDSHIAEEKDDIPDTIRTLEDNQ